MATIHTCTLACGMPLLVEVIPGVRSASVAWLLPAGAGADPESAQGLSTLFAELVLRGAGDRSSREQADALDRLGLARSSDVGPSFLRLSATMIGDRLPDAMALLTDMVLRPRFEPEAIAPSKDLALQALAGLADDPAERASILLVERHGQPPLNRSGLGTVEGLTGATRETLLAHWAARVRPRGSILAVAGAVDPAALARRMDALLAGWEGAAPEPALGAPASRGTYHHEADDSNQVHIYLAHEAPREADPDSVLERIVGNILSAGPSARLFTELRERRGLCYSVHASYITEKHAGRVVAYVGTTPERAQQSLDVLTAELRRMTGAAGALAQIEEDEFRRALVGAKSRLVFSGESTAARAGALAADQHRLGRPRSLDELAGAYARVQAADVRAYLSRRSLGRPTIVTLGPSALAAPELG